MPKRPNESRITVVVTPALHDRFSAACKRRGVSQSAILGRAVRLYAEQFGPAEFGPCGTAREDVGDLEDECHTFD